MISGYESNINPPAKKLTQLINIFNISAHCLATGKKLYYKFNDINFSKMILNADHFLSIEEHKMLIHLMEKILQNQNIRVN